MRKRTAGMALLGVSVLLAALLLTGTITIFTCCLIFAVALVIHGLVCRRCCQA